MSGMSQGGRAMHGGESYRDTVRQSLQGQGGLAPDKPRGGSPASIGARLAEIMDRHQAMTAGAYRGFVVEDEIIGKDYLLRPLKADFILWRYEWRQPLALAVQSQDSSGSADQKLAHKIESLRRGSPLPFAVLLAGRVFERSNPEIAEAVSLVQVEDFARFLMLFVGMGQFDTWIISRQMALPQPTLGSVTA